MKLETNRFKQALAAKQVQYGYWLALADPYATEIAATAGFDWLLIDGEHAPNDLRSTLAQLQAIAAYPSQPVVRPVEGSNANIKQLLDIGAHNLLIPMVETAEQAEALVSATRYPPAGTRGVGAALGRSSRWLAVDNYDHEIENEICLVLQIESRKGLDNIDSILAVEGYDGVFIGPVDLAASMGHIGDTGHAEVQAAISEAIVKIAAAGKAPGILSTEAQKVKAYRDMGAIFIAVGVDTVSLASAARDLADSYRQQD